MPKEQKGGIQITSFLKYSSIKDENFVPAGVSKHMKKHWECDICHKPFIFNLDEILEHRKMCGAKPHDDSINYLAQEEKLYLLLFYYYFHTIIPFYFEFVYT